MAGILEELSGVKDPNSCTVIGDAAFESEVVLMALEGECQTPEELTQLIETGATEMAMYGLINNPQVATEAVKKIQIDNWKEANFNRIAKRTAIRMAMVNGDALYTKYKKYRDLLIENRDKIYKKYGAKAKVEARKIIKNARNKAANMTSATGKDVTAKIDKAIAGAEARAKGK